MASLNGHKRYCIIHGEFVDVDKDLYGSDHHFLNLQAHLEARIAKRDRDVLNLFALSHFMCYGTFTETPPPDQLTAEEWELIFAMEDSVYGTENP